MLSTLLVLALTPQAAPGGRLLDPSVRDLLHEELSGEIAKEHVIAITRHHRVQGSPGYHEAAQWVLDKLHEYGFDEEHAWLETFPTDGRIQYQTWQSPAAGTSIRPSRAWSSRATSARRVPRSR